MKADHYARCKVLFDKFPVKPTEPLHFMITKDMLYLKKFVGNNVYVDPYRLGTPAAEEVIRKNEELWRTK
jgi:hypothetical protein